MKKCRSVVSVVTVVTALAASAAFAREGDGGQGAAPGAGKGAAQKDICLIYPEQCHITVDTIQERIERLNREIGKGTAVYTEDELSRLKSQLRDAKSIWLYINGDRPTLGE